ncbi:hypothetical protein QQS21_003332 [Conoideocrella luteorostrata]|uniref:Uncharacterized protein n=1 Tax=Conoideocrella luteorostrata TaxID=1105319 RepID=A0AAJ0CTH4_9HYPO|nr:hypothetical protein QQS21_003332 [Conoideocrella luteorostrata]
MAMCSMDTISDATSSSWAQHLAGAAAAFQRERLQAGGLDNFQLSDKWSRSFEGKWLLRNFAYHDILMSVSLEQRPHLTGDYWMSEDDALADPYFAFASRILFLTGEISIFNADCAESKSQHENDGSRSNGVSDSIADAYSDDHSLHNRAQLIATELRQWTCPSIIDSKAPLALLSEAYRSAALIYLCCVLRKHFPQTYGVVLPEGVEPYTESICYIAEQVPVGSLAECSLLFPLFIAGGEAENARHVQCIRDRLYTMNKWRRFRNVDACKEVLDEVWRHRNAGGEIGWRDVVQRRGWQLSLS